MKPDEQITHCSSSVQQNQNQKDDKKEELKEMKSMIQSLTNTVKQLGDKVNSSLTFQSTTNQGFSNTRGRGKNQTHFCGGSSAPRPGFYNSSQTDSQAPPL